MKTIRYSLFSICILLFANRSISQVTQRYVDPIQKYLDMEIELSQDTVSYGDEITLTVIYKNKSDSCVSFYPRATLLVDIYYPDTHPIPFISPAPKGRFLTNSSFYNNLVTLPLNGIHKEFFTLKLDESFLFKYLYVRYICTPDKW